MTTNKYRTIHALYCRLTGRQLPLDMGLAFRWELWESRGWTEADLRLVIGHIQSLIKQERRRPESLRLYNLINPERFAEDLSEARALSRVHKPMPRDRVLAASGRPNTGCECNARSAAQVMADNRAFENWKLWRNQTGL